MPRAKTKIENYPEIENIKEDLNSLKDNVIELTRTIKDDGVAQTKNVKDATLDRYETYKEQGMMQVKRAEAQVKNKPLQSIAGAFAAGLVFSMLMRRR